jgi:hypothetical protein
LEKNILTLVYNKNYILSTTKIEKIATTMTQELARTRANPTIASYNASVVNFYNTTVNLAHFENANLFL